MKNQSITSFLVTSILMGTAPINSAEKTTPSGIPSDRIVPSPSSLREMRDDAVPNIVILTPLTPLQQAKAASLQAFYDKQNQEQREFEMALERSRRETAGSVNPFLAPKALEDDDEQVNEAIRLSLADASSAPSESPMHSRSPARLSLQDNAVGSGHQSVHPRQSPSSPLSISSPVGSPGDDKYRSLGRLPVISASSSESRADLDPINRSLGRFPIFSASSSDSDHDLERATKLSLIEENRRKRDEVDDHRRFIIEYQSFLWAETERLQKERNELQYRLGVAAGPFVSDPSKATSSDGNSEITANIDAIEKNLEEIREIRTTLTAIHAELHNQMLALIQEIGSINGELRPISTAQVVVPLPSSNVSGPGEKK